VNLEQLRQVAWQLLLASPDRVGGESLLRTIGGLFPVSAACLFDGDTAELSAQGVSLHDLAERTKQAYLAGEDHDNREAGVSVRCLRAGSTITGAIGFEGLTEPEWVAGPLSVLASAALEQARAFRKASHETAAAEAEVFRTAILDALGHEFKTPLATILAVVGALRESPRLRPEEAEMAGLIEMETSRLNDLTNRLLRMARLDREEIKPRMRSTDIASLVGAVVQRYSTQTHDRHIVVEAQGTAQTPADRQLLDLAVTQLLDNAFKYSAAGSAVTVGIAVEGEQIALRVRNEGSSIAPEEQNRIFERFYRGSGVRNLVSGAGLGLYVARKIAVAHGGTLDLDKTAGPGAVVFCLKLPLIHPNGTHHHSIRH
jgi:two-component system sensor histidine kinase KdpD